MILSRYKNLTKRFLPLATIIIASAVFHFSANFLPIAHAQDNAIQTAIQEIKTSVDALINIKDRDDSDIQAKEIRKIEAAKTTLLKILDLGSLEVTSFKNQLDELAIENLVTADYTFDAAEAHDILANTLKYYTAYYEDTKTRANNIKTYGDAQNLAKDLKTWREKVFNPGTQRILSLNLVLRNKDIVKLANNRFIKIVSDLRKLKDAKLITLDVIQSQLNGASASIKSAEALDDEATAIAIKILKIPPITSDGQNENVNVKDEPNDYEKIENIVSQSFGKIRDAYKKFIETNSAVKKMINGQ